MATNNTIRPRCATKPPIVEIAHKKQPIPPESDLEGTTPEMKCLRTVKPNKLSYNGQDYDISGPEHEACVADFTAALDDTTDATYEAFAEKWGHLKLEPGAAVAFPYEKDEPAT